MKNTLLSFFPALNSTIVLCFLIAISFGQVFASTDSQPLFFVASDKEPATLSDTKRIPVNLNHQLLSHPPEVGQVIDLPVSSASYRVTQVNRFVDGYISVTARNINDDHDQLTFSYGYGRFLGDFAHHKATKSYRILPESDRVHQSKLADESRHFLTLYDSADSDFLECGLVTDEHSLTGKKSHHKGPNGQSHIVSPFDIQESSQNVGVPIDLMIVYTEDAKDWADEHEGGIELLISQMMNKSQMAFDNSYADIELRIVHLHETDFQEDGNDSSGDLHKLTTSPDFSLGSQHEGYMSEIHELRNQSGADLVAMLAKVDDVGGLAWLLSELGGSPQLGFSINRIQQVSHTFTFVHEIGHNLGNAHSRNQQREPANIFGGLFDFSTGKRFTLESDTSVATIMAYREQVPGSRRIAYFSNPELHYNNTPIGGYAIETGPADNVRSMRYSRHIVSQYRPSQNHPPVLTVGDNLVEMDIESGQSIEIPLQIRNDGTSTLHWTADIGYDNAGFNDGPLAKTDVRSANNPISPQKMVRYDGPPKPAPIGGIPFHYDIDDHRSVQKPFLSTLPSDADDIIYETGFESDEQFQTGDHLILNGWVAQPRDSLNTFRISSENPGSGNGHLRLSPNPKMDQNQYTGVRAPFSGALTTQPYSVSMDLRFSSDESDNQFHLFLDEPSNNRNTAWVFFDDGEIIVQNQATGDNRFILLWNHSNPGEPLWKAGEYFQFEIRIDPLNEWIQYLVNGEFIDTAELFSGTAPEQITFAHLNHHTGETFDLDNLSIKTIPESDFLRFQAHKPAGAVAPGDVQQTHMQIYADDLPGGFYEFDIAIHSNDPFDTKQNIPIRIAANDDTEDVSVTPGSTKHRFALQQNYPNPFNPQTTIPYSLARKEHVQLEVIDITGRHVATLVDEVQQAGTHYAQFDASGLASGIYLYRLRSGMQTQTGRMSLVK